MNYRVFISDLTIKSIHEQARYIAIEKHAPLNAARWLERMLDAADSLEHWPYRCALALENEYRDYEVRKINVGEYLLLFTIIQETNTVWVIGFRHGRQHPRPDDLPQHIPGE